MTNCNKPDFNRLVATLLTICNKLIKLTTCNKFVAFGLCRTCKLRKFLYKCSLIYPEHEFHCLSLFPQVAAEGLQRILSITKFWPCLTQTEQFSALGHLKKLFDLQLQKPDVFVLIKLLEATAYKNVVESIVRSRYQKDFMKICLRYLQERNKAELHLLNVQFYLFIVQNLIANHLI